ncbi:MAG TPA: YbfB/YjiJ family MFS transporter, partial [Anaerolineales bacterium]|nr:YbfB/YjiJ family MFS transporter [Anaerolineales bacterium]
MSKPSSAPAVRRPHYGWAILAMGVLVVFGALGLARFGYSLILPPMQTALDLSNTQAGGLVTANLLGYVIFSAVGGALAAHYRVRHVIAIGLLAAGLGMLFTGLAGG